MMKIQRFYFKSSLKFDFLRRYSQINNDKIKVTFFGSDLFSLETLKKLNNLYKQSYIYKLNVVTSADSKINNKNKVIEFCDRQNIEFHYWNDIKIKQDCGKFTYENLLSEFNLGLVASFGHIIPSRLINIFKL